MEPPKQWAPSEKWRREKKESQPRPVHSDPRSTQQTEEDHGPWWSDKALLQPTGATGGAGVPEASTLLPAHPGRDVYQPRELGHSQPGRR